MEWGFWKKILVFGFLIGGACLGRAQAGTEIITVPVILADYYAWAYTEAIEDKATIYGFSTAGVDLLGWGVYVVSGDEAGMKLVNVAGISKTLYPVATLLWASDEPTRERAWIALGTHTATLLTLELLGRPALSINTALGPGHDGTGMELAYKF